MYCCTVFLGFFAPFFSDKYPSMNYTGTVLLESKKEREGIKEF
jgi:hypothetical protein